MLGAGWDQVPVVGQTITPHAVVAMVHVPWTDANRKHSMKFDLIDEDNAPVQTVDPAGSPVPVTVDAEFEVGRPPGVRPGSDLLATFTFTVAPGLPLVEGKSYSWVCNIDAADSVRASFRAVSVPAAGVTQK